MIVHIKIKTHMGTLFVSFTSIGTPTAVTNINTAYNIYMLTESNPEK